MGQNGVRKWGQAIVIKYFFLLFSLRFISIISTRVEKSLSRWRSSSTFFTPRLKAILKHLGLWLDRSKPTPKAHAPPALKQSGSGPAGYILDHFSQLPLTDDHLYRDPDYPWEAYLQS